MKEKIKHKAAFEYYYSLGPNRRLKDVATEYRVCLRTVLGWSSELGWAKRIEQKERESIIEIKEKTNKQLDVLAEYRKEIAQFVNILKLPINEVIANYKKTNRIPFEITNLDSFHKFIKIYSLLIETDLKILGIDALSRNPLEEVTERMETPGGIRFERIMKYVDAIKKGDLDPDKLTEIPIENK